MSKLDFAASALGGQLSSRSRSWRGSAAIGARGIGLLSSVPLFAGLSRRDLRRVAELAEVAVFDKGELIVQRGSPGGAFYVIAAGKAKVVRDVLGHGRAIARLGPGDFFGELALLDSGARTASVVAETPIVAVMLARTPFRRMLTAEPKIALKLLEELARRFREREKRD